MKLSQNYVSQNNINKCVIANNIFFLCKSSVWVLQNIIKKRSTHIFMELAYFALNKPNKNIMRNAHGFHRSNNISKIYIGVIRVLYVFDEI